MSHFIRKYLLWIIVILRGISHKGFVFLLQRINIDLEWSTIFSKEFVISCLFTVIEYLVIGYTLIGCTEPSTNKDYKIIRTIGYIALSIILFISLFGILAHYELIN